MTGTDEYEATKEELCDDFFAAASQDVYKRQVFYYVDGETDPCFEEEYEMGTTYQVNPDATAAGQKDNCLNLVCWYTDPECTQPYDCLLYTSRCV